MQLQYWVQPYKSKGNNIFYFSLSLSLMILFSFNQGTIYSIYFWLISRDHKGGSLLLIFLLEDSLKNLLWVMLMQLDLKMMDGLYPKSIFWSVKCYSQVSTSKSCSISVKIAFQFRTKIYFIVEFPLNWVIRHCFCLIVSSLVELSCLEKTKTRINASIKL